MFDLYWTDGWNEQTQEPAGAFVKLAGDIESPQEAMRQLVARAPAALLDYGPGECVVLNAEATRALGENVRVTIQDLVYATRERELAVCVA